MTNLQRLTGKIFGETATATGDDPQIGQFGSALNGTYVGTTDVATIQSLPAWSNGFIDSVTPNEQFPPLPEMTGFGKVLSYQTAYTLQKGVPEWDAGTTYYTGDFCKGIGEGKLYVSKIDSNINNDLTDTNSWEEFSSGSSRNIGEIVPSTIPLTDAGLHLLDGSLIQYGSYQAFVDYIAGLVSTYPDLFETEANWQAEVLATGFCDKYVYDSVNNTVRLPKIGNQLVHNLPSTLGVKGNGLNLGLTDGSSNFVLHTIAGSTNRFIAGTTQGYGQPYGATAGGAVVASNKDFGVTTDTTKSGLVAETDNINTADVYYYVVIATTTKSAIQVDIDEIATDLNGKMDIDGTNGVNNLSVSASEYFTGLSFPSTVYENIAASTGSTRLFTYTAPADGWVTVSSVTVATANRYLQLVNSSCYIKEQAFATATNAPYSFTVPVSKGQTVFCSSSANFSGFEFCRFVYAKGEA